MNHAGERIAVTASFGVATYPVPVPYGDWLRSGGGQGAVRGEGRREKLREGDSAKSRNSSALQIAQLRLSQGSDRVAFSAGSTRLSS